MGGSSPSVIDNLAKQLSGSSRGPGHLMGAQGAQRVFIFATTNDPPTVHL